MLLDLDRLSGGWLGCGTSRRLFNVNVLLGRRSHGPRAHTWHGFTVLGHVDDEIYGRSVDCGLVVMVVVVWFSRVNFDWSNDGGWSFDLGCFWLGWLLLVVSDDLHHHIILEAIWQGECVSHDLDLSWSDGQVRVGLEAWLGDHTDGLTRGVAEEVDLGRDFGHRFASRLAVDLGNKVVDLLFESGHGLHLLLGGHVLVVDDLLGEQIGPSLDLSLLFALSLGGLALGSNDLVDLLDCLFFLLIALLAGLDLGLLSHLLDLLISLLLPVLKVDLLASLKVTLDAKQNVVEL